MDKKLTVFLIVCLIVVVLGGAYVLYGQLGDTVTPQQLATTPTEEAATETTPAPDVTVYTQEGTAVKLSDYLGKPIVLNFWASWCGPCQMEMPDFQETFLELGDRIQFLMVNVTDGSRETVDTAASFIAQKGYTFPVFYDTDLMASNAYQAYSLPTTYFIDAQGNIIARATGAIDGATLQKGIDMITK